MLKTLMLRKKANDLKSKLEAEKTTLSNLLETRNGLETREAELETAIQEANSDEEREVVEAEVEQFEKDREANETEVATQEETVSNLESEVEELERQIAELEKTQRAVVAQPINRSDEPKAQANSPLERKDNNMKTFKTRAFNAMTITEREAFVQREDVQKTIALVKSLVLQERAVTNGEAFVGTSVVEVIRANVIRYSKVLERVNLKRNNSNGRVVVQGVVPEAIWTECCARINELDFSFGKVELDCFKVAAFVPVCNAIVEDSDIDLIDEIIEVLSQALGLAIDKAIVYGTGVKMPTGIVTAIKDIATQVKTLTEETGLELYSEIISGGAAANGKYSRGTKTWMMNETTYTKLVANSLAVDGAGAIAAGMSGKMPGVGGDILVLDFIPDNNIVVGYLDLYVLQERSGWTFSRSNEYRFVEDETVIKARARYDGKPAVNTAFAVLGIGVAPTTTIAFAGQDVDDDSSGESTGSGESEAEG